MTVDTSNPAVSVSPDTADTRVCWSCGEVCAGHFCASCGKVQPAISEDHFSFFELPRKLNLDKTVLQKNFYELSRRLHPDVYARASAQEQTWSLEKSSQLNDAYRKLKDPIHRTEYFLQLEGVQLEEQSKAATEAARVSGLAKKQVVPPALLEEVFELNMQLEEMRMSRKAGEVDPDLIKELEAQKQKWEGQLEDLAQELKGYWDEWDGLLDRDALNQQRTEAQRVVRDKMVDLLNRRNYIRNLVRDVGEVLEESK